MKIKGPAKFSYPRLKLSESEVEIMARSWLKSTKKPLLNLSAVEEALLYGAKINPEQSFRVVIKISRKTNNEKILKMMAVHLLEDLVAYSALKIKHKLLYECKVNSSFKIALSHTYLTHRDKGYLLVKSIVKRFHYL